MHETSIDGSIENLAERIGNLRYDALSEFLFHLARKLEKDSAADLARGRPQLATRLDEAKTAIDAAWRISKPYMV